MIRVLFVAFCTALFVIWYDENDLQAYTIVYVCICVQHTQLCIVYLHKLCLVAKSERSICEICCFVMLLITVVDVASPCQNVNLIFANSSCYSVVLTGLVLIYTQLFLSSEILCNWNLCLCFVINPLCILFYEVYPVLFITLLTIFHCYSVVAELLIV